MDVFVCMCVALNLYFKAISFTSIPLEYCFYNLTVSNIFSAEKIELRKSILDKLTNVLDD